MDNYYLQVVKKGEEPNWPRPEEDLDIGSQELGGGYTQYWAFDKGVGGEKLPFAEVLANDHLTEKPAILIDAEGSRGLDSSKEHYLTLVLVKDGHAWGKTESSLANLEDNLNTLLDFAKNHFNIKVDHFMTTSNVPEEVEKKLDEIENQEDFEKGWEEGGGKEVGVGEESEQHIERPLSLKPDSKDPLDTPDGESPWDGIKKIGSVNPAQDPQRPSFPKGSIGVGIAKPSDKNNSKLSLFIPLVIILLIFGSTIFFKDQVFGKVKSLSLGNVLSSPTPTPVPPTPTPTPTPTPEVKREEFKVRVLNGTTKSGAAAALKEQLSELGWDVVKTGNAKNQKFEQTTISVKKDLEEALKTMVEDLKEDFEATEGASLDDKDQADVEVVIGKK